MTMVYDYSTIFIGSLSDLDSSTVVFLYVNTMC